MTQQTKDTVSEMMLGDLQEAVRSASAFRCRRTLQPAGGPGDKVFPPTYAGAVYAVEDRRIRREDGTTEVVPCVLLDSVQSQANRMEEALQDAVDDGLIQIPVIEVRFPDGELLRPVGRVTSLQVPHRMADAILRDSLLNGTRFPDSEEGERLALVDLHNATPLYELCPTALVFGLWDSTGPRGGLGAKFQRAIVSEIVGINASFGTKTSSRIDPLGIRLNAGPIYRAASDEGVRWTTDPDRAAKDGAKPKLFGKDGKPSEVNHGNVVPSLSNVDARAGRPLAGGVTIAYAEQTTVLSLPALRRLRFPNGADGGDPARDAAARTVLAALGLCAATMAAERGLDLRSRCLLWPDGAPEWELLDHPGEPPARYRLDEESAVELLAASVTAAADAGLRWRDAPVTLEASTDLVDLVRRSQQLAVKEGTEEGAGE